MTEENKTGIAEKAETAQAKDTVIIGDEAALAESGSGDKEPEKKSFWNENKIEIIVAILLGATALLTAWASWIGSLHSGIQSINFTKSNNMSSEAGTAYDYELQLFISDVMTWNKMVDYSFEMALAEADGNQEKADMIKERLQTYKKQNASDILSEGIEWLKNNENGADSPFEMPGINDKYFAEAKTMYEEAHDLLKEGQNDNARGDAYNLVSVLYSLVLFLLGIIGIFKRLPNRIIILSIAAVILVGATIYMLTIPLPTGFNMFSFIGLR